MRNILYLIFDSRIDYYSQHGAHDEALRWYFSDDLPHDYVPNVDPDGARVCTAVVPDQQLSLAIGNKGQNVRLAAKLTGWKIDIKSESQVV